MTAAAHADVIPNFVKQPTVLEDVQEQTLKAEPQNTTFEGLNKSWRDDTWQIHGELPASEEKPYNQRKMIMRPLAKVKPMDILRDAGIAVVLTKGDKYGDWAPGQDNVSVSLLQGGWEIYCVADGHGAIGHWVATHVTRSLPYYLAHGDCKRKLAAGAAQDPRGALLDAFELTQQDLVCHAKTENLVERLAVSGATFACILKDTKTKSVWVAHLGDSRTIMFSPSAVLKQTEDHKAEVESELKRVVAGGCEVRTKRYEDGFESSRIYVKGKDYPGIMMSRCFGDLCVKNHGITAIPDVAHWEGPGNTLSTAADANECYILCASDGIWEFMDNDTVHVMLSRQLSEGGSLEDAASELVKEAKLRWGASEPDYCDDISVIILPLTGKALAPVEAMPETCCAGACLIL